MAAFCLLALCGPALAGDPAAMARRFAHDYAVPRFQAVAKAAHAQADAWNAFCATAKSSTTRRRSKASFDSLADAWARVEFVRVGPAATGMRVERFNWWLDRTGATAKALDAMLAAAAAPTPEKLASGSVAGQGLPVIERLLYDKEPLTAQRCAVGTAVARGQAAIADAIVADWISANGALAALDANTRWNNSFADASEAASVMLTDLAAGLEGLKDLKVAMLLHDARNPSTPPLAEAVRSGRVAGATWSSISPRSAKVSAISCTTRPLRDRVRLDAAFDDAQGTAQDRERSQAGRKGPHRRHRSRPRGLRRLEHDRDQRVLPMLTGLTLGFNNLDGD